VVLQCRPSRQIRFTLLPLRKGPTSPLYCLIAYTATTHVEHFPFTGPEELWLVSVSQKAFSGFFQIWLAVSVAASTALLSHSGKTGQSCFLKLWQFEPMRNAVDLATVAGVALGA